MNEKLIIIESPYAGDTKRNLEYAKKCMRDSLMRGEYPLASHLLYTQEGILEDRIEGERELGIEAGLSWAKYANKTVVYTDLGITIGMYRGIQDAHSNNRKVEYRKLYEINSKL